MANATKFTVAGADALHVAYRNNTGHFAGAANLGTASTPNTGSGARKLIGVQTFPAQILEPNNVAIPGDDGKVDTFQFENADVNQAIIELGVEDAAAADMFEGTTVLAVGDWNIYGRGGSIVNPGNFMFILTRQGHAYDSGSPATSGFVTEVWLNAQIKPLASDGRQGQTEGKSRLNATFNDSNVTPWVQTMVAAFTATKRTFIVLHSLARMAFHIWIADGAAAVTTALDYTPITAARTKAWNGTTGAALTVSSINTSTKLVTLSAVPLTGVPVILAYETAAFA